MVIKLLVEMKTMKLSTGKKKLKIKISVLNISSKAILLVLYI